MEKWHIPLYSCKAVFWIQLSDVKHSVILRSMFAIDSTFTYLLFFRECATPPYIQLCHCTWLGFTRPSPTLVLPATNAGVRRPGYEAMYSWPMAADLQCTYSWPAYSWPMYSQPDPCKTVKRKVLGYHSHQVLNVRVVTYATHKLLSFHCEEFWCDGHEIMYV